MSKTTSVISSLAMMITMSMSGSIHADDFQQALKQSNNCETVKSLSSGYVSDTDSWSMNGKVRQFQYEVETRNKKYKQSIAIMEKPGLNIWRENLGDPVKL